MEIPLFVIILSNGIHNENSGLINLMYGDNQRQMTMGAMCIRGILSCIYVDLMGSLRTRLRGHYDNMRNYGDSA